MTEQLLIPSHATMVHNHGFVAAMNIMASDLHVVNAARVSYAKRSTLESNGALSHEDKKLIRYLMTHKHGTPFEHNLFTFHVRAPIFVMREWHRHRIGWSYNEESGRYVEFQPHFYMPSTSYCRDQTGEVLPPPKARGFRDALEQSYVMTYDRYSQAIRNGVAREIARLFLPLATYSQMYATCNARSLMRFLMLRNDEAAMREIRDYAMGLEKMFAECMPVTYEAFVINRRIAP